MEDDPTVRRLLLRLVRSAGWEALAAADRAEAFHLFERGRFKALLSDIDLAEGEDGIRLAKELRLIDPALKIVMMSGRPGNENRARKEGLELFLPKPFDLARLTGLLRLFRLPRGAPKKPNCILIVEDDPAVREMLAHYVNAAGWEAVVAKNGAEALEAFQTGKFRLLLADVRLDEGIDGIEVAKRLLGLEPDLKVAMISGVPGASDRVKAAGLDVFLPKPVGLDALADLLELGRAHHENGVSKRILLIEDDAAQLDQYCQILRGRGYQVLGVQSAEEALKRVESERFDAILTDNILPGMTGLRAIPELKKKSKAPILLMTSRPSPDLEEDALLMGAAAFFAKPLDLERLDEKLRGAGT
ncbi:MAG TPA: hypothetical protein DCM05_17945 [Elusimicrobia bacterium]|nr:hypothetical protein [Elusimicrobiota bacterium]